MKDSEGDACAILNTVLSPFEVAIYGKSLVYQRHTWLSGYDVNIPPFLRCFSLLLLHMPDMSRSLALLRPKVIKEKRRRGERIQGTCFTNGASLRLSLFNRVARAKRQHVAFCLYSPQTVILKERKRSDLVQSYVHAWRIIISACKARTETFALTLKSRTIYVNEYRLHIAEKMF